MTKIFCSIHRFSDIFLDGTSWNFPNLAYLERPDFATSEQVIKRTLANIQVLHNLFKLHNLVVFYHNNISKIFTCFQFSFTDMLQHF